MKDQQRDAILKACEQAVTAVELVHLNIKANTHAGQARALSYLSSIKKWSTQIDQLQSMELYSTKLAKCLNVSTIDERDCDIELHQNKRVILIHGAFDLDRLRQLIITV